MTTYLMGFGDAIAKEKIIDGKLCIRDLSKYILMLEIAVKVQEDRWEASYYYKSKASNCKLWTKITVNFKMDSECDIYS